MRRSQPAACGGDALKPEPATPNPDDEQLSEMLELFAKYQRRLYGYIRSMVLSAADADDVLQETNIVVWSKFDQYRPGSDFRAWVFQIAFYEIHKYHQRKRKQGLSFSDELLEQLSTEQSTRHDELDSRREALTGCVRKLNAGDFELVNNVYSQGQSITRLAEKTGREKTSIYRSLRRIRRLLFDCIESTLARHGGVAGHG
jgi:RNA polymerase sigma-70 factor (ECF subfamily)